MLVRINIYESVPTILFIFSAINDTSDLRMLLSYTIHWIIVTVTHPIPSAINGVVSGIRTVQKG
jgi:hypothetical protein